MAGRVGGASLCSALLLSPLAANAISVSGDILVLDPPPANAGHMALQSNDHAFFWTERIGVVLTIAEPVNVIPFLNNPSGHYDSGNAQVEATWAGDLSPGIYNSYFLHGDKQGSSSVTFAGQITFDSEIEAIIYKQSELVDTDAILGAPGTVYAGGGSGRIFELDGANNWFTISADRLTFSFQTVVKHNMDDLRVVTAVVPEPGTALLLGLGLSGYAVWNRRRRDTLC